MKISILIAESSDIHRIGLRTVFAADKRVTTLYEASNSEELQKYLCNHSLDLIIVNQTLVDDITALPPNHFVLLAPEFNIATFLATYKHGGKGYLLEASQAELFHTLLSLPEGGFLIDPSLSANIVEYITNDTRLLIDEERLTPREREIVKLLREGVNRNIIAQQLNISAATLKTHIKNIFRKRHDIVV